MDDVKVERENDGLLVVVIDVCEDLVVAARR